MVRVKQLVFIAVCVALCAFAVGVLGHQAAAQPTVPPPKDVYAVKFLCGTFKTPGGPATNGVPEGPVKPGNYLTAINVHNPNGTGIKFRKKALLLYRGNQPPTEPETPMRPHRLRDVGLQPDWGLEIDCRDIRTVLLQGPPPPLPAPLAPIFIKGWVVIEVTGGQANQAAPLPLDVTAVYTSHGYTQGGGASVPEGFAEDVETILPKRVK